MPDILQPASWRTAKPKTARGLVSRVSPVQTALRNCTRDEGRSFEVGNQVLISSHRKLLLSKATVVNVAEKSGRVMLVERRGRVIAVELGPTGGAGRSPKGLASSLENA